MKWFGPRLRSKETMSFILDPQNLSRLPAAFTVKANAHSDGQGCSFVDLNLPDINWNKETVLPYATSASVSNQLLSLAKDFYLDQMITQPARITETTVNNLELFFTSNPTLINMVETIPGISDHEAVFIESSLRPLKVKIPPRMVFQYKKADNKGTKKELRVSLQQKAESEDTGYLWTTFRKKHYH